jgi:hypothetical protein
MPELDMLKAVVAAIEGIQPTFIGAAPQVLTVGGVQVPIALPYFVVHANIPGRPSYYFGGSVDAHRIQIDQFYRWTGQHDDAYSDNAAIASALDGEALGGVMMKRVTLPAAVIEEGKTLHMFQTWEWEEVHTL